MKRSEMIEIIYQKLINCNLDEVDVAFKGPASDILDLLEEKGMKPPCVDSDKCQAIMTVYIDSSFNMWDEEFEKDSKLVEAYNRRMARKK